MGSGKTTMTNPRLPPEILDYILDTLHGETKTLWDCCIVAKSWIPRTRKHLFADVNFSSPKDLESWKKAFPDPSNSPACYTHTLSVKFPQVVTAADGEEDGWIRTFSRVVCLAVDTRMSNPDDSEVSLPPSMDSRPSSNLSTCIPTYFHTHKLSALFVPYPISKIWS